MRSIQIIGGAANATCSVLQATDEASATIFPDGRDIKLVEDFIERVGEGVTGSVPTPVRGRPILKRNALGVHGALFHDDDHRRDHMPPSKREVDRADGSVDRAQRDLFVQHR